MKRPREHPSRDVKSTGPASDIPTMHGHRSLIARLLDLVRRRDSRVLLLVNTTRGQRAVPVPARDLR